MDLWRVCESHLTISGQRSFDRMLRRHAPRFAYSIYGHPVLPRTEVSDVGRWSGVGILSQWPSHRLPYDWPQSVQATGRLCVATTYLPGHWISGCVVYGTPSGPTHSNALQTTDQLINHAIKRVLQLSGPRYVGGDLNQDHNRLEAVGTLRRLGFVDIQDLHCLATGCPPVATCRGKTRRDFLFVSPELASMFCHCTVEDFELSDHSTITGHFRATRMDLERFPWPRPDSVQWGDYADRPESCFVSFQAPGDVTDCYRTFWQTHESSVQRLARARGKPLPDRCFGRGQQYSPTKTSLQVTPLRAGRSGDLRPSFLGFSQVHRLWFRQLRRLESYCRLVKHGVHTWQGREHRAGLWNSILHAVGFRPSFASWWSQQGKVGTSGLAIPTLPPDAEVAFLVFDAFHEIVRDFEKHLKKHQRHVASFKRASGLNAVYGEVKRDKPAPVSLFVPSAKGVVSHVDEDDQALEFSQPVKWIPDSPFVHGGRHLEPIFVTEDKLWCEDVSGVAVGDVVVQSNFQGKLSALFDAFHDQWRTRWLKHPRVEPSQWQQILDFAARVLRPVQCAPAVLDVATLQSLIKSKSKRSGVGLDGVSQSDLAALDSNQFRSVLSLFERAELDGEWPLQCMAGSVQSLAKVDTPTGAGEFRPVTVLGLLYRLWSSHHSRHWLRALAPHLDENLTGNRPGHSPATVWRKILSAIDHSHRDNTVAAGFVVDLVKAYNTLPRYPVLYASKLLGVGQNTLMGWTGALSLIRRHFAIRGSFSEGLRSTTGLPEGCGLSCLGMLVLDALLHRWMDALHPSVSTYTFVDNWEVLVTQEAWLEPAFERLESFVHHLDLELDRRKTYFWSTSASFRAQLRRNGRFVQGSARDLGAHVAYTRQLGNHVLTDRIQSLSSFWDRLLASPGSHALKVKAIVSAAWPRAFHACSSAVVGRRHLDLVRTQIMKALKLQKPGASPWLQFASDMEGLDPVQWIISSTIKDFRDDPSGVLPCSVAAVDGLLSEAYTPGSLHEILLRIHQLGWRVVSETAVADSFGVFDLRDTPMQSLHFRMQWAWTRVVAQKVAHRPSLQNFVKVDRGATKLGLQEVGAWEQGVLRRHLNGACTANDRACFWSTNGSTACVLCGQLDSIAHRLWSCSGTAGLRAKVSDFVLAHASSFPEVLSVHCWTLASPYWFEWVQALLELPSAVPSPLKSLPANQIVDLFTDGSCLWPDQPRYRLASFAVVWAEPLSFAPSASQCSVLAAAGLSGVIQTAYRAELMALCVALDFAARFGSLVRIWTDCSSVLSRFTALTQSTKCLRPNSPHNDLWQSILASVRIIGKDSVALVKVPAHEDPSMATDAFESWIIQGNASADNAARAANLDRSQSFWSLWERHAKAVHCNDKIGRQVRNHIVEVAKLWNEVAKPTQLEVDECARRRRTLPVKEWLHEGLLSYKDRRMVRLFGASFSERLLQWFNQVWHTSFPVIWISFSQLFVLFQLQLCEVGVAKCQGKWVVFKETPGTTPQQFAFSLLSKWFRLSLQQLLKSCGAKYRTCSTRPSSAYLQCHLGCIALPVVPDLLERVEVWLGKVVIRPVKGQGNFLDLPLAM